MYPKATKPTSKKGTQMPALNRILLTVMAFCAIQSALFGETLAELKEKVLTEDAKYMEKRRDEAVNKVVDMTISKIPARTPDIYVRNFIFPYTDSSGVYKGSSIEVFKYRDGKFVVANESAMGGEGDIESFEKLDGGSK